MKDNMNEKSRKVYKSKQISKKKKLTEAEKVYKSRHAVYERVSIVLFIAVLFFMGLCLVFLKRPTFSESEKRDLAPKPELNIYTYFTGIFADQYTKYFSDTVPFREQIVALCAEINDMKGISAPKFYGNVNVVADDDGNLIGEETAKTVTEAVTVQTGNEIVTDAEGGEVISPDTSEAVVTSVPAETVPSETTTVTEEEEVENIADFSNNGIVVDGVKMYGDNAGVMLFGGNKKMGTRYAELLSRYKAAMGPDVNVYNIVVPTSVEFYLPKKFQKYSSSEKDAIDHIYSSYTEDIIAVDAYSEIAAHTDEYIYLRTDHHWSHRGAYYAYKELMDVKGETAPPLSDFPLKTGTYTGSFASFARGTAGEGIIKSKPDTIEIFAAPKFISGASYNDMYMKSFNRSVSAVYQSTSSYMAYLGGDNPLTVLTGSAGNGKKAVVIKESFGNAFAPWLLNNYSEVYVVDVRKFNTAGQRFKIKEFYDFIKFDDLIIINYPVSVSSSGIRTHLLNFI